MNRGGHFSLDVTSMVIVGFFLWPAFVFWETWGFTLAYAWCAFLFLVACALVVAFASWTARIFKKKDRR